MTKNSAEHATPVDDIPARMLRYGGMHLITLGGVVAIDWVLLRYLNIDVPPVVRTIVPPIVAAQAEGMWLAAHLFGEHKPKAPLDYRDVPTAVFCHPNIGTVGLSQEEALAEYGTIRVYKSQFRPMRYTLSDIQEKSMMKLIVDDASDRVVGLHMAGEESAEITQGFAVAVRMGATKADFDATVGIHPTAAEELVTMRQGERITA